MLESPCDDAEQNLILKKYELLILVDRVRFFKESKERIAVMCKAMEDMRNESLREGILEGMKSAALRLEAGRYTLEEIAAISGLSLDEGKELKAERIA